MPRSRSGRSRPTSDRGEISFGCRDFMLGAVSGNDSFRFPPLSEEWSGQKEAFFSLLEAMMPELEDALTPEA